MPNPQSRLLALAAEAKQQYLAECAAGGEPAYPAWIEDALAVCGGGQYDTAAPGISTVEDDQHTDACPRCGGSGQITVLSDNSPDAHDVEVCCDHCQGTGAAVDAAKYLAAALSGEKYRHMQIYGEFKNFHRRLCARFGYAHDDIHFRRDLVSLEEAIASKVSAPAAGDGLADPALQKLFGEAITGALAFGAQGVKPPPVGHWLEPFWNMARADAAAAAGLALLDHSLLRDVLGYVEDAGPGDVWGAAQSWMSLRDAAIAAVHPPPAAGDAPAESAPEWATCESRGPWVRNGLMAAIHLLREKETRARHAFTKGYMGAPARYIADAYGEAAAVVERKLGAIAAQAGGKDGDH